MDLGSQYSELIYTLLLNSMPGIRIYERNSTGNTRPISRLLLLLSYAYPVLVFSAIPIQVHSFISFSPILLGLVFPFRMLALPDWRKSSDESLCGSQMDLSSIHGPNDANEIPLHEVHLSVANFPNRPIIHSGSTEGTGNFCSSAWHFGLRLLVDWTNSQWHVQLWKFGLKKWTYTQYASVGGQVYTETRVEVGFRQDRRRTQCRKSNWRLPWVRFDCPK